MERHVFVPRWDETEKGYYCAHKSAEGSTCGVLKEEHQNFDLQSPEVVADIAWLLEAKGDKGPMYLSRLMDGSAIFTYDVDKALRFSRKEDAESIRLDLHGGSVFTATEHVWV